MDLIGGRCGPENEACGNTGAVKIGNVKDGRSCSRLHQSEGKHGRKAKEQRHKFILEIASLSQLLETTLIRYHRELPVAKSIG